MEDINPASRLQAGGSLLATHFYVERDEDKTLRRLLEEGRFCHVLGPAQTGKSSLAWAAVRHLRGSGIACVFIDFNKRYTRGMSAEDFYFDIMRDVATEFDLQEGFLQWEHANPGSPLQAFLVDFVLTKFDRRFVLFLDELDCLLDAPFRHEFLLQLRALFNERAAAPELARFSCCLIGTFPVESFLVDSNRTAFNIVRQVLLSDFTLDQVRLFTGWITPITSNPNKLILEVHDLIGGHPYMLQTILVELISGRSIPVSDIRNAVNDLAARLLVPSHDQVIGRTGWLIWHDTPGMRGEDKLRLYKTIWDAGEIDFRPQEPSHLALRLSGAAVIQHRVEGDFLAIRNRFISDTFNDRWIAARFQELYSAGQTLPAVPEVGSEPDTQLRRLTHKVDELFCGDGGETSGPYRRTGAGTELLKSTLYIFPLETRETGERLALQIFLGIEGLGGQLWEQEVRALLRLNTRKHDTLPTIRDGGHYRCDDSAKGTADEGMELAYIVTEAGRHTLAQEGVMEHFRANKAEALRHLNLLAEGLAILHRSGLMHRNLHPGTVEVVTRDLEGRDTFLRMARFEMAPLISNLLRRLDPANASDEEDRDGLRKMDDAIRSYYLDEGALALACVAPERLGSIYDLRQGSVVERANTDVFSLGMIAYQWFVGQLPRELLLNVFGKRNSFSFERWEALLLEMMKRMRKAPLHARLKEMLENMLERNPRTRWQSAEVVDHLVRYFDAIDRSWDEGERSQRRPYLIAYLPEEIGDFLRRTGLIHGDPRTPAGREELHRFLSQDLGSPTLSFAPLGAAGLFSSADDRQKKSRYVLQGTRLAYFSHLYEEKLLPSSAAQEVPQVLVIRYSVEQGKVRNVNMSALQRRLSSIEVVGRDSTALDLANRATRPLWKPLLQSVERNSAGSPQEMSFLRALEWLLDLQSTRLDARTYPVRIEPANPSVLIWDKSRDNDWLTRSDLGALLQSDSKLRPNLTDYFEHEADKKGNEQLSLLHDNRGSPDYRARPAELWFDRREGKDSVRVKPLHQQLDFTTGWLQIADDEGTRVQLEQQRRALFHLARMPELIAQLQHPSTPVSIRQRWPDAGYGLDGRAPEIIRKLLDSRPMFALQGPPGTGKTTVIADAVQRTLDRDRNIRILIAAQSHYALDNLLEKIDKQLKQNGQSNLDAVRVVSPQGKKRQFSPVVKGYFIERLVSGRKQSILTHCDTVLEHEPAHQPTFGKPGDGRLSRRALVERWRKVIEAGDAELHDRLRRGANLVFSTTGTATESYLGSTRDEGFDWVIVDEAAKAWPTELVMPLVHGQRWALVGDHKQLAAFGKRDVVEILHRCKSSPLQELQLIGDQAEDFLKVYGLFRHMIEGEGNVSASRGSYLARPVEVLNEQYRMHPAIADLISRRFYDNALLSAAVTRDRRHDIKGLEWLGNKAVVWVDTKDTSIAPENPYPKWNNPMEVTLVQSILTQLGAAAQRTVVLSPYGAQMKKLSNKLKGVIGERVHTVDSFQGREEDIVIVSMVRCNDASPGDSNKRLGFLDDEERVNVLFSRGRKLLIIIGCFDQFYKSESEFWPMLCDQIMSGKDSTRVSYLYVQAGVAAKEAGS